MTPTLEEQAESIVREHGATDCRGHFVPELPFCAVAPKGSPLCEPCRQLKASTLAALQSAHAEGERQALEKAADEAEQFPDVRWTRAGISRWLRARAAQTEEP